MKKYFLALILIIISGYLMISGCSKQGPVDPCNNLGQVCFENKLDTVMTVTVQETRETFTVHKDEIHCISLTGGQPYTFTVASLNYNPDTNFMVQACDQKLIIIQK